MITAVSKPSELAIDTLGDDRARLLATAAPGVFFQSQPFQAVTAALQEGFGALLARTPDLSLQGAPVIAKRDLERSAYVDRFPQLVAAVAPHRSSSTADDVETAMTPAACLSLYPMVAQGEPIGGGGLTLAVTCACHRNEAAYDASRLRTFTMSELVFFGRRSQVEAQVHALRGAVGRWLESLGLSPLERAANDPFYGRGAEVMAQRQRALQGKTEIVLPIGAQSEVACFSFNLHGQFFSQRWEIALAEGGWATSACAGVGLERLALALIERHGDRPSSWPDPVRRILFGEAA